MTNKEYIRKAIKLITEDYEKLDTDGLDNLLYLDKLGCHALQLTQFANKLKSINEEKFKELLIENWVDND